MTSPESFELVAQDTFGPTTADARTWVMSPTRAPSSLLLGLQCECTVCGHHVLEPTLCANCGVYGHVQCINGKKYMNYTFCGRCLPSMIHEYEAMEDALRRHEWQESLSSQLLSWKQRARDAVGMSASVGLAIGGAAATAVGAVAAVAQGMAQGASSASQGQPALQDQQVPSVPPPPVPAVARQTGLRRSNSLSDVDSVDVCGK